MASLSGWTEGILLSLAFVALFSVVTIGMNLDYNKEYVVPFADDSNSETLFVEYMDNSQEAINGGEVSFTSDNGISLKSSYGMIKDAGTIVWSFISGGWIEDIIGSWHMGEAGEILAKFLRILYFLSVVAAFLYILFKVIT